MNLLDIILFIILIISIYRGAKLGIAYMFGQIVGVMVGVLIAGRVYDDLAVFLQPLFLGSYGVAAFFSFVVVFQVINELLGLGMKALNLFAFLDNLPVIGNFKSMTVWIGAFLGLFVGNLIIGVILYFLSKSSLSPWFDELMKTSYLGPLFVNFASWYTNFFPPEFRELQSVWKRI